MSSAAIGHSTAKEIGRSAATALNDAALLRDVLIREIRALGALYCVGRRKPISELTPEQQQRVREAYRDTGWSSDYCVDLLGIYTSKTLAEEACRTRGPNYFFTKLPIDSCLTDETVFGDWAHQFPGSDATELYENLSSATLAITIGEWRMVQDELERLRRQVKSAQSTLDP